MARHLVTGGSGFVGSHTAEFILDKNEEVKILDIDEPDIRGTRLLEETQYIKGDVRNLETVEKAIEGVDYVHHNVAKVPLTKAGNEFKEINVEGTRNVMKAASREEVQGVTHISSSAVYDISEMPVTESTKVDPIGQYGQSKLDADRVAMKFSDRGLPVNVIRPRTIVDERRAGIYYILFDWIDSNKNVYLLGDGQNDFQLISAKDVADISYISAISSTHGEVFNVGSKKYNTLEEDIRHVIRYANSESSIFYIPARLTSNILQILDRLHISPLAPWHYKTVYKDYYFDISKVESVFDWTPSDSSYDMLERAYDWYCSHDFSKESESQSIHRKAPKQKILSFIKFFS